MKIIPNILLKTTGAVIFIYSVIDIPINISYYLGYGNKNISIFLLSVIVPTFIPIIVGMFLFFKYDKITNLIIENSCDNEEGNYEFYFKNIEKIALSVLGFYLLFVSISDLSLHFSSFLATEITINAEYYGQNLFFSFIKDPTIMATFVEFIFSIILILKVEGIVNSLKYLRR